jgi:TOBE domain
MTDGAKTLVASKGRPRANSTACDRAEAVSSTARQRPDAGSQSPHGVLASPPASDRAPGSDVADRLARLETLDLSAMRQEWRRIVVMNEGAIEQIGSPGDIYNRPRTRFVASFVRTLNSLQGVVVDPAEGAIRVGQTMLRARGVIGGAKAGETRSLALRPEALRLGPPADGDNALTGVIEDATFLGAIVRLRVRIDGGALLVDAFNSNGASFPRPGDEVKVSFSPNDLIVLDNR